MRVQKVTDRQYREAAERLYGSPLVTVNRWGAIHRTSDGGAFVDMTVWVPEQAIELFSAQTVKEGQT